MKKIACLLCLSVLVCGLLPFLPSPGADAYTFPSSTGTYVNSIIKNGVTLTAYLSQLDTVYNSTNPYVHTGDTPFLVVIQIYNNNTSNALVNTAEFDIRCKDASGSIIAPTVSHIENLSPDLMAGFINANYIRIDPSVNFSYGNGIVVPAKRSIYMESIIYCSAINGTSSTGAITQIAPTLAADAMRLNQNMTVTVSDTYTYVGETTDVSVLNNNLSSILADLEYTGQIFDFTGGSFLRQRFADYYVNDQLRLIIDRCIGKPTLIMSDQVIDTTSDTNVVNATLRYPVVLSVYIKSRNAEHTYRNRIYNRIRNLVPSGYGFVIDQFSSNYYNTYAFVEQFNDGRLELYSSYQVGGYSYIPPLCTLQTAICGHFDVNYGDSINIPDFTVTDFYDNDLIMQTNDDLYYPLSSWEAVRDIYNVLIDPENGTAKTEAEVVADTIDNIHAQEQQYFSDNSSAISQSGLGNYQFDNNAISAFGIIRSQFTDVWNALGKYTLVYTFTLIISLATFIIRHEPTTKVKQWRESVKNERYERTQYYGHKNAEYRAAEANKRATTSFNQFVRRRHK